MQYKVYLGDGVYADFDGFHIVLTANDSNNPTDTIFLDSDVLEALQQYVSGILTHIQNKGE